MTTRFIVRCISASPGEAAVACARRQASEAISGVPSVGATLDWEHRSQDWDDLGMCANVVVTSGGLHFSTCGLEADLTWCLLDYNAAQL